MKSLLTILFCAIVYTVAAHPTIEDGANVDGAAWELVARCTGGPTVRTPCDLNNQIPACTGDTYPFDGLKTGHNNYVNDHLTDCNNAACPFPFVPSQQYGPCEG